MQERAPLLLVSLGRDVGEKGRGVGTMKME